MAPKNRELAEIHLAIFLERNHFASDDQVVIGLDGGEVYGEIFNAGQSLFLLIAGSPVLVDEIVVEDQPRVLVTFVGAMNLLHKAASLWLYLGHRNTQSAVVGCLFSGLQHAQCKIKTPNEMPPIQYTACLTFHL